MNEYVKTFANNVQYSEDLNITDRNEIYKALNELSVVYRSQFREKDGSIKNNLFILRKADYNESFGVDKILLGYAITKSIFNFIPLHRIAIACDVPHLENTKNDEILQLERDYQANVIKSYTNNLAVPLNLNTVHMMKDNNEKEYLYSEQTLNCVLISISNNIFTNELFDNTLTKTFINKEDLFRPNIFANNLNIFNKLLLNNALSSLKD